jgi:hypothetical protein
MRALKLKDRFRRQTNAGAVADLVDNNRALILCARCERRLGRKWTGRMGYWQVPNVHAARGDCDYCLTPAACNLYVKEGEGYHREAIRTSQGTPYTVNDRRRIFK